MSVTLIKLREKTGESGGDNTTLGEEYTDVCRCCWAVNIISNWILMQFCTADSRTCIPVRPPPPPPQDSSRCLPMEVEHKNRLGGFYFEYAWKQTQVQEVSLKSWSSWSGVSQPAWSVDSSWSVNRPKMVWEMVTKAKVRGKARSSLLCRFGNKQMERKIKL